MPTDSANNAALAHSRCPLINFLIMKTLYICMTFRNRHNAWQHRESALKTLLLSIPTWVRGLCLISGALRAQISSTATHLQFLDGPEADDSKSVYDILFEWVWRAIPPPPVLPPSLVLTRSGRGLAAFVRTLLHFVLFIMHLMSSLAASISLIAIRFGVGLHRIFTSTGAKITQKITTSGATGY